MSIRNNALAVSTNAFQEEYTKVYTQSYLEEYSSEYQNLILLNEDEKDALLTAHEKANEIAKSVAERSAIDYADSMLSEFRKDNC